MQEVDGWQDSASEPFKNPTFLLDIFSLECGYIKFASPPSFMVVPYGSTIPPRPAEKMTNDDGKERNAFLPGFRCKVYNPKMFGDDAAYHFSNNSKTVINPMDELYSLCIAAPEAKAGKVPLIKVTGTTAIKIDGPKGINTYYAPVFTVAGWHDRPAAFGERTVALTGTKPPAQQQAESNAWSAHTKANGGGNPRHVGAPPPAAEDWGAGPPAGHPANAAPPMDDLADEIPF